MTDPRVALAVGLATATLALFLVVIAMGGALQAGLAPWPGIAAVVMATAAFILSEKGSYLVAALLAASGVVGLVYGLIRTELLAAAAFPGPLFGVILGLLLLGLGVGRAIATARAGRH